MVMRENKRNKLKEILINKRHAISHKIDECSENWKYKQKPFSVVDQNTK